MTAFTAADLVRYISALTIHQRRVLRDAIDRSIVEDEAHQLIRESYQDQRVNPNTHGMPHGLTTMNEYGLAIAEARALARNECQ